ncbi:hypothetical protein ACQEDT_23965 [Agrobacterium pusense]|uniref:hypothetical protein n=1 Tax=Agrobacterium pusense TaxID=648995 RepID=UPI003D09E4A9
MIDEYNRRLLTVEGEMFALRNATHLIASILRETLPDQGVIFDEFLEKAIISYRNELPSDERTTVYLEAAIKATRGLVGTPSVTPTFSVIEGGKSDE